MPIGCIPDSKLIGCIVSKLWPPKIQDFPIEANTKSEIFLLEAPPVEKFLHLYGLQWGNSEVQEAVTRTLYILFTSNLGCSLSAW